MDSSAGGRNRRFSSGATERGLLRRECTRRWDGGDTRESIEVRDGRWRGDATDDEGQILNDGRESLMWDG